MTQRPPSLLDVERLRQGLLDDAAAAEVQARLEAHGDPAADLPSDATTFADDPPDRFLRNVAAVATEQRVASRRRRVRVLVPVLVAAVALFIALPSVRPGGPDLPDVLLKGDADPSLTVFLDTPDGPRPLHDGEAVAEGDRLQLAFRAAGMTHGVLYSVDGRGALTVHHRFAGDLPPSGTVTLPSAYRLDDAPRFEAFHLVGAFERFDIAALLEAAPAAGRTPPALAEGVVSTSLVVAKVAP